VEDESLRADILLHLVRRRHMASHVSELLVCL